jgi:hypothetical protein
MPLISLFEIVSERCGGKKQLYTSSQEACWQSQVVFTKLCPQVQTSFDQLIKALKSKKGNYYDPCSQMCVIVEVWVEP